MENGEEHACLIATPAGATQEQLIESSGIFTQHFVRIFRQKVRNFFNRLLLY